MADSNGKFSIHNLSAGTVELVCSYLGYQPYSQKIEIREGQIYHQDVKLIPLVVELNSVEVKAKHDVEWESQLKKFKIAFLGQGANASACKILNPWHLEFKEERTATGMHFSASSAQPLEIENMALGYHITYYLKRLEHDPEMYLIEGRSRFKELMTTDSSLAKVWASNRAKAFLGSTRHLLESLREGRAKEEGFLLYFKMTPPPYQIQGGFLSQIGKSVYRFPSTNIVSPDAMTGLFRLSFEVPVIEVHYSRLRAEAPVYPDIVYPVSWLEVKSGSLFINSHGKVMNPANLFIYGAMSFKRIADLLPDDYSPGYYAGLAPSLTSIDLSGFQEKVYVHTDKPYYYPGENIWLKAYMNYRSPVLKDTMSRVLYVELISKERKIVTTKIIKINNGIAYGGLSIPKEIFPGSYFIRVYTQWMLNFSSQEIFTQYVPILPNDQTLFSTYKDSIQTSYPKVLIETDKKIYHSREKVDVRLLVVDEKDVPQQASLSVSITDLNQVASVSKNSILTLWSFIGEPKITLHRFPLESGISFSAICKNKKGKPIVENLLFVKDDSKESVLIDTHADGRIWITGLQFEDSATFSIKSVGVKKFASRVDLIPKAIPRIDSLIEFPLRLKQMSGEYRKRQNDGDLQNSILLKPVVIQATRLDEKKSAREFANSTVDGETLAKLNPSSLLFGLNSRFPFLRVNTVYEGGSLVPVQRVNINSTSSFSSGAEPLLYINGLQVNLGGEPIYDILRYISPDQVERVEINKLGSGSNYSPTYGYRGSISIFLKQGSSFQNQIKINSGNFFQQIKLAGYQHPLTFTMPDYSPNSNTEFSDLRSTIYWNPQLTTDGTSDYSTFSFYSADIPARYKIEIEGVTNLGKPIRSVSYIEVIK